MSNKVRLFYGWLIAHKGYNIENIKKLNENELIDLVLEYYIVNR